MTVSLCMLGLLLVGMLIQGCTLSRGTLGGDY